MNSSFDYYYILLYNRLIHFSDMFNLEKIYNQFLKDFQKLINQYQLKTPLEIYALFHYALKEGYLSVNHQHKYQIEGVNDVAPILGTTIFTGQSVCRHTASMLSDILNTCQISSCSLSINIPETEEETLRNRIIILNKEQNHQSNIKEKTITELHKNTPGNHLITATLFDGEAYYIDPTHHELYLLNNKIQFLTKTNFLNQYMLSYKRLNALKNNTNKLNREIISSPNIDIDFGKNIIETTFKEVENNPEELEKFYQEHEESYQRGSELVKKLTYKKKIR